MYLKEAPKCRLDMTPSHVHAYEDDPSSNVHECLHNVTVVRSYPYLFMCDLGAKQAHLAFLARSTTPTPSQRWRREGRAGAGDGPGASAHKICNDIRQIRKVDCFP